MKPNFFYLDITSSILMNFSHNKVPVFFTKHLQKKEFIAVISNFHHRRHTHGRSNSGPFNSKLNLILNSSTNPNDTPF